MIYAENVILAPLEEDFELSQVSLGVLSHIVIHEFYDTLFRCNLAAF